MDRDRILDILGWGAFAFACTVFLLPVVNPDIYWHLSAGKYTLAHYGPPRADFLSWPLYGTEWVDFEWLPQVFYYLLHEAGGFRALQVFKALLLVSTLLLFRSTALLYGRRAALPLLLPFFAAGLMSNCDLRPENFTLLLFAVTLYFLEKSRLSPAPPAPRYAAVFAFFALWTNLHAGYLYGLALVGLYAAGEFFTEQLPYIYGKAPFARPARSLAYLKVFAAGLAASFVNPYGWKIYAVIANHQKHIATLQAHIQEWGTFDLTNPYQWPYVLALAGALGSFAYFTLRRRYTVYSHFAALLFFAWASANHSRHIPFFIMTGLAFALALPWEAPAPAARRRLLALAAAAAGLLLWFYTALVWTQYRAAPRVYGWGSDGLAAFLRANKGELSGLKLYNHWGWGGWLGWELAPDYRPFIDGRYLFHDKINEVTGLRDNAANWPRLIEKYKFDLMLIKLDEPQVPVKQRLADGREEMFWRPAYLFYLPRRDWAVIYWDSTVAALARRSAVPAAWLAERELRYLRPGDTPSLPGPLLAGEVSLAALRRERDIYLRGHLAGHDKSVNSEVEAFVAQLEALCARKGAKCAK
ncbi:MAG TPA: hypothetical protein DEQ38_09105 [Elusimicrobia bacterium]|nr:MAG: hypothetical protein A2089_01515 [Elusimicrobia bacterium GWD2_63_28]HCC48252.1 hypothetical protein [Elusimicrobiota bacterium]